MVKSQPDKVLIITNVIPNGVSKKSQTEVSSDVPPQIPPRMKKKGPALPEKPPHMRAKSNPMPSSQPPREPLRPRILPSTNVDKQHGQQREILVAASKAVRERPVERRQREPAKLLVPTGSAPAKKEVSIIPSKSQLRLEECINASMKKSEQRLESKSPGSRKTRPLQPILLIPRGLLSWGSAPVSYALWMQRDAPPNRGAARREPVKQQPKDKFEPSTTSARARSGSVARSGSLTSQGSSSSESGNETFPKSVLKKQKRNVPNSNSKGSNNRKVEQKKNVTFNAFATVQLMEE